MWRNCWSSMVSRLHGTGKGRNRTSRRLCRTLPLLPQTRGRRTVHRSAMLFQQPPCEPASVETDTSDSFHFMPANETSPSEHKLHSLKCNRAWTAECSSHGVGDRTKGSDLIRCWISKPYALCWHTIYNRVHCHPEALLSRPRVPCAIVWYEFMT